MNPSPRPIELAADVARHVLNPSSDVTKVYLYGGNAAGEETWEYLDLLFIVPDQRYQAFRGLLWPTASVSGGREHPGVRLNAASRILDLDADELADLHPGTKLDVFLLPPYWASELERLHQHFPSFSLKFWQDVRRTAQRFNAKTGQFEPALTALAV